MFFLGRIFRTEFKIFFKCFLDFCPLPTDYGFMVKILHTSDLHFSGRSSEELEYSLFVWRKIQEIALDKSVDAILLAGDVFDRFLDLKDFRKDFLDCISEQSPPIYAITGNHEYIGKTDRDEFHSFSLSPVQWFYEPGFFQVDKGSWELILIPYSPSTLRYREWEIPPKSKPRILMAHGILPEALIYTGPSSEEGDHILELDLLQRFEPDSVALGHIHKATKLENLSFPVFYCGSPRIWRRGEEGVRSVNLFCLDSSTGFQVESIPIREAGINREIILQVTPSGEIPIERLLEFLNSKEYCPKDSVYVTLMGFAESEHSVQENLEKLNKKLQSSFRNLEWNTQNLNYMSGISELSIVKSFLKRWEDAYNSATTEEERLILEESRQIGLDTISKKYRAMAGG